MKDPNPPKTTTRKGRTQPSKAASSKTIPPSIDETAPLLVGAPSSRASSTDQNELWMYFIPIFNEYQKYCIDRALSGTLDTEGSEENEVTHRSSYLEMMQFRSSLFQKLLTSIHMDDISSELTLVTISKLGKEQPNLSLVVKKSNRLAVICGCFTQALDCAVASLLTREVPTTSKGTSNSTGSLSSMSGSVACISIFEFIVWFSVEMVILQDKNIASGKPSDVLDLLDSDCYEKLCLPVLSHICKYAECSVDTIRIVAVRSLCFMAECLGSDSTMDPSSQGRLDILDSIQQALLPRFTDKTVAVRCVVVQACFPVGFGSTFPDNPLRTDPDILQALQWIVQHDPSPNNRMIAIQHAPVDRTTMEYIIPRMRDTKVGVRTSVLASVSKAIFRSTANKPADFLLQSRHIADIVTSGYTDRCLVTKDATCRTICTSLIKASRFNPFTLLEWVNLLENTSVASSILKIWVEASKTSPSWIHDFSESELQSFQHGLHESIAHFSIADIDLSKGLNVDDVVGSLFVAHNLLKFSKSSQEKEAIWSQLVPDVSVLCQVLEAVVNQLVQVIASKTCNEGDESINEDKIIFICQELLKLATVNTGVSIHLEEGSRRILMGTIKNLLSNVVTPDDLLEGCVAALKALCDSSHSNQFNDLLTQMFPVVDRLMEISTSSENELFSIHTSIRVLSLITLVLETQESADSLPTDSVSNLMKYVVPAVSHSNVLLRQAAVRTMGLLGSMIAGPHFILQVDDFVSCLLSVATNVDEGLEIRVQAMFALTDWSMLHYRSERLFIDKHNVLSPLCDQVDVIFNASHENSLGTICCVGEIATKMILLFLLSGPTVDSFFHQKCLSWLAHLVVLFFDPKCIGQEDEYDDAHHVGNPVRLQQFLSSFFSAMTSTHPLMISSKYLLDSIAPLLAILLKQQVHIAENSGKSKVSAADVLRWTRSVDFIVSSVVTCKTSSAGKLTKTISAFDTSESIPVSQSSDSSTSPGEELSVDGEEVTVSSPLLEATLQVAKFLSQESSQINVAFRRGLCKSIASMMMDVDVSCELWEDLSCLKKFLEELVENDGVDDGPCRRTLSPVLNMLVDVESDECDENEDDEDVASLSDAFGKVDIDPQGSENMVPSTVSKTSTKTHNVEDPLRRTRRLRTSN